jgi:lysophospholipase L1-like esterase
VLFVGDSFAAGNQVNDGESMVAVAERNLNSQGLDVDALNAGSQGLGTSQQVELLHHLVETMRFEAVVLVIFASNDLLNNWEDGRYGVEDGALVQRHPLQRPFRTRLRTRLVQDELLGGSMVVRLVLGPLTEGPTHPSDEDFELERLLLLDFAQTARAHGAAPVFALVGTEHDCVADSWWTQFVEGFRPSPRTRVAQMLQDMDAPWVDLCTVANRAEHYNNHYTPAGNEVVGAAIADLLAPLLEGSADR